VAQYGYVARAASDEQVVARIRYHRWDLRPGKMGRSAYSHSTADR
jgi:hypothetical protein